MGAPPTGPPIGFMLAMFTFGFMTVDTSRLKKKQREA
jgi:hypothetical protein